MNEVESHKESRSKRSLLTLTMEKSSQYDPDLQAKFDEFIQKYEKHYRYVDRCLILPSLFLDEN